MVDILNRVGIKASLDEVYRALATREVSGASESERRAMQREHPAVVLADYRLAHPEVANLLTVARVRGAGAFHAPRGMLEFWIDPESPYHKPVFAQDRKYVFFCAGGWRSALAAATAQDMGLKPVAHNAALRGITESVAGTFLSTSTADILIFALVIGMLTLRLGSHYLPISTIAWGLSVPLVLAIGLSSMAQLQRQYGDRACRRYVVSFTRSAADVAAVRAFWAAALGYTPDRRTGVTDLHDPRAPPGRTGATERNGHTPWKAISRSSATASPGRSSTRRWWPPPPAWTPARSPGC